MPRYRVSSQGQAPVVVEGPNWISALGAGLEAFGAAAIIDRLACEVLPNGTVIARDARRGTGFVIQPDRPGPRVSIERHGDELFSMGPDEPTDEVAAAPPSASRFPPGWRLALEGARSPQAAWDRALDVARRVVPSDAGAGFGLEDEGGLRFLSAWGQHAARLRGLLLPAGVGVAGFSARHNASLLVHEAAQDGRFFDQLDHTTGFTTREILCVPVGQGRQVYGCLELLNPTMTEHFTEEDLGAVGSVAEALGALLGGGATRS